MKKTRVLILLAILLIFSGCSTIEQKTQMMVYSGLKITKISYESIDYMGGYKDINIIDFNENNYYFQTHSPEEGYSKLDLRRSFTEEEEKIFLDACYTYGLFDIDDYYSATGIDDGGGWKLIIEYEDGTIKTSIGNNAYPDYVFEKCSTYFYELCGQKIYNYLPEFYLNPPTVTTRFGKSHHWYGSAVIKKANYQWNSTKSLDNDLFLINEENKNK